MPENFKDWIKNNRDRIARAKKYPYFIKDNQRTVNDILNPKRQLTPLEIAKKRHEARTPQQIEEIKKRWQKKQQRDAQTKKHANMVLNLAKNWEEVDYSALEKMIATKNLSGMTAETKKVMASLKAMRAEERALEDYLHDVHVWHKTHSLAELKAAHNSVESTMDYYKTKFGADLATDSNLEKLKKELEYKIKFVENPGKYKAGLKPKTTWQVEQDAYKTQLAKVETRIEIVKLNDTYEELLKFKTTAKYFKEYMAKAKAALVADNPTEAKKWIESATVRKKALEKNRKVKTTQATSSQFRDDAYTQTRKDKAVWDKGNGKIADDTLHDTAGKQWRNATEQEKDKVYEYTQHYCCTNEPLQGRHYIGHQTKEEFLKRVNHITSYINKNELPCDMWFMRGDDGLEVIASRIRFAGEKMPSNLNDLVGMVMQEGGFMSTGSRKGKGFSNKSVIMNIYAPKGTKATYIEPISAYGNGAGRSWNGIEKFNSFSSEHETLFQRGTKLRITKVYRADGKIYIDCEVIGQEIKDLSYINPQNIGY